jgi:flagellar biosynthesis protein
MPENKSKRRAAALQFDPARDAVPVLSAYGEGLIADKIIETAREHRIPVQKDPNLAATLAKLSVGDEIPPELYEVVARILVFVSEVDQGYGKRLSAAQK